MTRIASMSYSFFWKRKQHPPERISRETQVCSHIWRSPHLWFLPLPFFLEGDTTKKALNGQTEEGSHYPRD